MRGPTFSLLTGVIFLVGQGAAAAAADSRCLTRSEREGQGVYAARVHDACDARWRGFRPTRATSGKAYADYMSRCEKPCAAVLTGAVPSSSLLLGALAVGGAAAVASGGKGGGSSPASP